MTTIRTLLAKVSKRQIGVIMSAATVAMTSTSALLPAMASEPTLTMPKTLHAPKPAKPAAAVEDQLLIMASGTSDKEDFNDSLQAVHGTVIKTIGDGAMTLYVVQTEKGKANEVQAKLSKDENIAMVQRNYRVKLQAATQPVVNDPFFPQQWNLGALGAPAAWPTSKGKGSVIAVCDSGVPVNGIDLKGKVHAGYDAVNHKDGQTATGNHGAMVASTAACATDNKTNTAAVAPDATVFPMKICDASGYISEAAIIESIYLAGQRGIRIVNLSVNTDPPYSFSNKQYHPSFHAYADWYHNQKNGMIFLAVGNDAVKDDSPISPNLIVVSSVNSKLTLSGFSNYGNNVWFTAPGEGIYCTNAEGRVVSASGTSLATPGVAAVAAMVLSANPRLTNREIETILIKTSRKPSGGAYTPYYGFGLPNAGAAVYSAQHQAFFE